MWLCKVPWVPQLDKDKTVHPYVPPLLTHLLCMSHTLFSPQAHPLPSLSLLAVLSFLTFMGLPRDCGFVSSILGHSLTLALALHRKCDLL